jgi:hypothetical protein
MTGALPDDPLITADELARANLERGGEPHDRVKPEGHLAPLAAPDVGAVQARSEPELLLAHAAFLADLPDRVSERLGMNRLLP